MTLFIRRNSQIARHGVALCARRQLLSNSMRVVDEEISRKVAYGYEFCPTFASTMAYLDTRLSTLHRETTTAAERSKIMLRPPVVFLHGNPASSYIWRNILSSVGSYSRCFAPDLMGMGKSGPIPRNSYRFVDHADYLDEFFKKVLSPYDKVVLVGHDWGSALAFYWAFRNEQRVHAIIHMESIVSPMSYDEFPPNAVGVFKALRSPFGEELIYQKNAFLEHFLPTTTLRTLSKEEVDSYREPFLAQGSNRKAMLDLVRDMPIIDEGPDNVIAIVQEYRRWLCTCETPKLYIHASPGLFSPYILKRVRHWRNHHSRRVAGLHFPQEDSPREIADSIVAFLKSVGTVRR